MLPFLEIRQNPLHSYIQNAVPQFNRLSDMFEKFHELVHGGFGSKSYENFHVSVGELEKTKYQKSFEVDYLDRTARFSLASSMTEGYAVLTRVRCDMKSGLQPGNWISIGGFAFSRDGQTDLVNPEYKDEKLDITHPLMSMHIVMVYMLLAMRTVEE